MTAPDATGRLVITGVWICAGITMAASAVNGALTFHALASPWLIGLAIGIAVDIALCVALVGDRALHLAGTATGWGRALRVVTAGMSLALNCGAALVVGHYVAAGFHAFLPVLLVVLTEAAQSYTLAYTGLAEEARQQARQEKHHQEQQLAAGLATLAMVGARLRPSQQRTKPVRPTARGGKRPAAPAAPAKPARPEHTLTELVEQARPLVAQRQLGRTVLARELGVSTHQARQVLETLETERARPLHAVEEGA